MSNPAPAPPSTTAPAAALPAAAAAATAAAATAATAPAAPTPVAPAVLLARSRVTRATLLACALATLLALAARAHHALLLARLHRGAPFTLPEVTRSDALVAAAGVVELAAILLAVVALARWTGTLVATAAPAPLAYTPRAARWSWALPLVHLVRPLRVLRDVRAATDASALPEPPPRIRADEPVGYRDDAVAPAVPPIHVPAAPLAGFWSAWLAALVPSRVADLWLRGADDPRSLLTATYLDLAADVCAIAALVLAASVVLSLDARVREYRRRSDGTPPAAPPPAPDAPTPDPGAPAPTAAA